jgi:hypothetical protein
VGFLSLLVRLERNLRPSHFYTAEGTPPGQLRHNTDRRTVHRLTQLALAITLLITAKLIDWRNRWSPA